MSTLFNYTIHLGKSKDFQRCTVLIHLLCICLLYRSALPSLLIGLSIALMVFMMIMTFWQAVPEPHYTQLSFQKSSWILHHRNGKQFQFQTLKIEFEGGLFILLKLTRARLQKRLIIFYDQLSTSEYRQLQLTLKSYPKKMSRV